MSGLVSLRVVCAAVCVAAVSASIEARQPDALGKAAALVQQGRDAARRSAAGDRKAASAAKDSFEDAEKLLKQIIRSAPSCESCHVLLAEVYFGRGFLGDQGRFKRCIEFAQDALTRFPASGGIALYKGSAHYYRQEYPDAIRALNRYLASASRNAETDAMVQQMLAVSQKPILENWYNQKDFYQSNESRITRFNSQSARREVVFQVTPEYELQLGAQGFTAVTQGTRPLHDPDATAFLQQLVGRLTAKTPGPAFQYRVTLVDSPEVNAVTPPGHIIVYAGMLRFVETEAELAGVLAHELAHNYGHHAARQMIKAYHAEQLRTAITDAINPQSTTAQILTQFSTAAGVHLFLKAYSRFEEKEADIYGTHLMFNAGYHPTAMAEFHLKLYQQKPKQPVKFLSTHPPAPDRVDYVSEHLETFPLDRELIVGSSEAFKQMKARYPSGRK